MAVDVLGLTIMIPLLPFYAEHLGASPGTVGLLVATYAACQLVSGPLLGQISDYVGRRPLLLVSQVGTFIGFLVLAWAPTLWIVFLARIIDGVTAGNLSLAQAYISDITRPEERARSFGIIGIAFGMGFLIGPAISGFLARYDVHYPILAAAALSFTSIVATYTLLPSAPVHPRQAGADGPGGRRLSVLNWGAYAGYFRRPELRLLLAQFFAFVFPFAMFTVGFPLFAERRYTWQGRPFGPQEVGYFYAYVGFLGVILQGGLLGRLVKRFGESKLIWAGFLTASTATAALAVTYDIPLLAVVTTVAAFGTGVLRPALTSLITQRTSRLEQGVVLGLTQSLNSIAQIFGPMLAGFLIQHELLKTWAIAGGAVSAIGLAMNQIDARRRTTGQLAA